MRTRSHIITRIDCLRSMMFYVLVAALVLFAVEVLGVFGFALIPFMYLLTTKVRDFVHKDNYEPPYERCDGCSYLYSQSDMTHKDSHTLCRHCNKASPSQKEFALKIPMFVKRMIL